MSVAGSNCIINHRYEGIFLLHHIFDLPPCICRLSAPTINENDKNHAFDGEEGYYSFYPHQLCFQNLKIFLLQTQDSLNRQIFIFFENTEGRIRSNCNRYHNPKWQYFARFLRSKWPRLFYLRSLPLEDLFSHMPIWPPEQKFRVRLNADFGFHSANQHFRNTEHRKPRD